jgi:hypothetical protein
MVSVESISGMVGGNKGKWLGWWIQVWYIWYIVRKFVNATIYPHPVQNFKKTLGKGNPSDSLSSLKIFRIQEAAEVIYQSKLNDGLEADLNSSHMLGLSGKRILWLLWLFYQFWRGFFLSTETNQASQNMLGASSNIMIFSGNMHVCEWTHLFWSCHQLATFKRQSHLGKRKIGLCFPSAYLL